MQVHCDTGLSFGTVLGIANDTSVPVLGVKFLLEILPLAAQARNPVFFINCKQSPALCMYGNNLIRGL